jgi:hypothetical protein
LTSNSFGFSESVGFSTPTDSPVLLHELDAVTLTSSGLTADFDMRAYNSYSLSLAAYGGTFGALDMLSMSMVFRNELDLSSPTVFRDDWTLFQTVISGGVGPPHPGQPIGISDAVHGGWLRLNLGTLTTESTLLKLRLYGSYRSLPGLWLRSQPDGGQQVLLDKEVTLGAGQSVSFKAKPGVGRALATIITGAAGGASMTIAYAPVVSPLRERLSQGAANSSSSKELVLPMRQAYVTITNTANAIQDIQASIIQQISIQ